MSAGAPIALLVPLTYSVIPQNRDHSMHAASRVVNKCWKVIVTFNVACRKEGFEPTACAVAQRIRELGADQQELDRSARSMLELEIKAFAQGYAGRQMVSHIETRITMPSPLNEQCVKLGFIPQAPSPGSDQQKLSTRCALMNAHASVMTVMLRQSDISRSAERPPRAIRMLSWLVQACSLMSPIALQGQH